MLNKSEQRFAFLFSILVFTELIAGNFEQFSQYRLITKPSIILSLLLFFWFKSRLLKRPVRILTCLALLFSLGGDLLLLFEDYSTNYFMLGLLFFFMTHTMYTTVFLKNYNKNISPFAVILVLLSYALWLFYLIQNGLDGLKIPVIFYITVILVMTLSAYMRKGASTKSSYILVILGAILFVISDSILALNKFYAELLYPDVSIMLTYSIAQFFIVLGLLKES